MTEVNLDRFYKFIKLKKLNEAENEISRLLSKNNDNYFLINQHAFLLFLRGNFLDSILEYKKSININPHYYENYSGICACFFRLKKYKEIIFFLKECLKYNTNNCEVYYNLGSVLSLTNKLDEAITNFKKCITINQDYIQAYNDLGLVFLKKNEIDEAILIFEKGIRIDKKFGQLSYNLANILIKRGRFLKAIKILEDNLVNNNHNYLSLLANCLLKVGQISKGFVILDQILKKKNSLTVYSLLKYDETNILETKISNFFYLANFILDDYNKILTQLRKVYNNSYFKKIDFKDLKLSNKIKVAFLSSDFKAHAVSFQIFDVLKILSENKDFEIFIYNNSEQNDEITAAYKVFFKNWKEVKNFTNNELIDIIRFDNIQICVDLSGYTSGHRMPVFFSRVAPIQISWCGYLASAGMNEIDYIFADKYTIPQEDESKYSEKIYRLDKTWSVLSKNYNVVPNSNIPALKNKFISFASFNNILKINHKVVSTWSKILCRILNSKLYLFSDNFNEQEFKSYFEKLFLDNGVQLDQLFFQSSLKRDDLLNKYNLIDIALDTFPYSGGTTSLESYWMGVPVLTKKGDYFISKSTESINKNIGLNDWIANDESDYINKAVNFSNNLNFLQSLKTYLLENRETFAIFDSKDFAKQMFNAFNKLIIKQNA